MSNQQSRRTLGRCNFLFYLVITVIVAVALSRALPRLSLLSHHFGIRTSSSGPRINLADSGASRGVLPLHTQTAASQSRADKYHLRPDKVSSCTPDLGLLSLCHHLYSSISILFLFRSQALPCHLLTYSHPRWPTKKSLRLPNWPCSAPPS